MRTAPTPVSTPTQLSMTAETVHASGTRAFASSCLTLPERLPRSSPAGVKSAGAPASVLRPPQPMKALASPVGIPPSAARRCNPFSVENAGDFCHPMPGAM